MKPFFFFFLNKFFPRNPFFFFFLYLLVERGTPQEYTSQFIFIYFLYLFLHLNTLPNSGGTV